VSLCPPFYCSRCTTTHADECPPDTYLRIVVPAPAIGLHDWQDQAIIDLNNRSVCKKCGIQYRQSLFDLALNNGVSRRPLDGCPGNPPF